MNPSPKTSDNAVHVYLHKLGPDERLSTPRQMTSGRYAMRLDTAAANSVTDSKSMNTNVRVLPRHMRSVASQRRLPTTRCQAS